jgi:hypothetical protein
MGKFHPFVCFISEVAELTVIKFVFGIGSIHKYFIFYICQIKSLTLNEVEIELANLPKKPGFS